MDHPIYQVRSQLISRYPGICLEFSKYVYKQYGVTESREIFHAAEDEIDENWLRDQVRNLSGEQELALHSKVMWKSKIYHMPMIDFTNVHTQEDVGPRIQTVDKLLDEDIWIYDSGNSLHGYYFCLIEEGCWNEFLGKCLLCNSPREQPHQIIDPRWIGHSLEHGFSALRWSKNTKRHRSIPHLVSAKLTSEEPLDAVLR